MEAIPISLRSIGKPHLRLRGYKKRICPNHTQDTKLAIATSARADASRGTNITWHLPIRKLHLAPEAFASELKLAGFSVEWSRHVTPDKDGEPAGFQAICRKR